MAGALRRGTDLSGVRCADRFRRHAAGMYPRLDRGDRGQPVGGHRPLPQRGRSTRAVHRYRTRRRPVRSQSRALSKRAVPLPAARLAGFGWRAQCGRSAGAGPDRRRRRRERQGAVGRADHTRGAAAILARRIIACLDVRAGQVVKGVRFRDHRVVGDVMELAARYRDEGADELVFYDITASPQGRSVDREWVNRVARVLDIPFCVAGGIRSVQDAEEILNAGAEKVSVNSPALANPSLIDALSARFGAQCVVIGIDSQLTAGGYRAYQNSGDAKRAQESGRDVLEWVREVQDRGAGEIVLNCMGSDGVRTGYDIEQLQRGGEITRVPLVASGGAGAVEHFRDVFTKARVDAALAASVFHSGAIVISELKRQLRESGIDVRPADSPRAT